MSGAPAFTFAQLAVEVGSAATRELMGLEALEEAQRVYPHHVTARTIAIVRETVDALAEAHRMLRLMIDHEDDIRARIAPAVLPAPACIFDIAAAL